MMNYISKNFKLFVFVLVIMSIISCEEEYSIPTEALIEGIIVDLTDTPVSNVSIKKGDDVLAVGKADGTFQLDRTQLRENDVLSFESEGFVSLYRVYKEDMFFNLFMKKRGEAIVIDPSEAQTLLYNSKVELDIPKNAFSLKGKQYEGKVKIIATFFDVTNTLDLMSAPGTNIAQTEEGDLIPLSSYGLVEVLALTLDNEPVELIAGQKIDIKIPRLVENTPSEINSCRLNKENGYWKEAGTIHNKNKQLQGVITTVNTAWNANNSCGTQLVSVKINIQYKGVKLDCGISAKGLSYQGFDGFHSTNSNGDVYLMVCPNSVFELGTSRTTCCGSETNPQYKTSIDMSNIVLNPTGYTDIGTWFIKNKNHLADKR